MEPGKKEIDTDEKHYYNSASDDSENIIIVSHGDLLSVFNSMF